MLRACAPTSRCTRGRSPERAQDHWLPPDSLGPRGKGPPGRLSDRQNSDDSGSDESLKFVGMLSNFPQALPLNNQQIEQARRDDPAQVATGVPGQQVRGSSSRSPSAPATSTAEVMEVELPTRRRLRTDSNARALSPGTTQGRTRPPYVVWAGNALDEHGVPTDPEIFRDRASVGRDRVLPGGVVINMEARQLLQKG